MVATRSSRAILALLLIAALSGCSTFERAERETALATAKSQALLEQNDGKADRDGQRGRVRYLDSGIWLGNAAVRPRKVETLPSALRQSNAITLVEAFPATLPQIASTIARQTGLEVVLEGEAGQGAAATMMLDYSGSLPGLLDSVAAHYGLTWNYEAGRLVLSFFETRQFVLYSLPSVTKVTGGFEQKDASEGQSGTGTAPTAGKQSSSTESAVEIWDQIREAIDSIIGGQGRAAYSEATGLIVASTTPDRMRRVERYIREQNKRRLQQVAVKVELLSVTLDDADEYGLDLGAVFERAGISFNSTSPTLDISDRVASATFAILDNADGFLGNLSGSQLAIQALSSSGKVSRLEAATLTTLNDQPAPLQVGSQVSYLASVQQSTTADVGTTTSLTPGVVTTGLALSVLPRILPDNRVLLQVSITLNDLRALRTVSSGLGENSASIQVPELDTRTLVHQTVLQDSTTLVVAGFERQRDQADKAGIGDAGFFGLGGGRVGRHRREILILLLTPSVLPTTGPPADPVIEVVAN